MKRSFLKKKMLLGSALAAILSMSAVTAPLSAKAADAPPKEILLGAFWESDENNTDTLYWSLDGVNFYELSEAYTDATPDSAESGLIADTPYPVSTLHDPGLIYKDGYFWMLSGFCTGEGEAERYVPMIGYSEDLVNWSYPNSGSKTNVPVTALPIGKEKYQNKWDGVAPDFMVEEDGTVWITVCLGYYAQFHGDVSANDTMQPYLIKATGLSVPADADTKENKGAPPVITYSDAVPINLPVYGGVEVDNRIDSSLYKEGDYYYLCVKKDGVTNEIWRTRNMTLDSVQKPENWELVCDDAVTGFEGPCLTKYQGQYYLYTDKLADYPPRENDGKRGVHVSVASVETTGQLDKNVGFLEKSQQKIVGHAADGSIKETRHGSVMTVTDPEAIKVIWDLKNTTRYADVTGTPIKAASMGWYQKESFLGNKYGNKYMMYWYENGVRQGLENRGKEIYDPESNAWFWLDSINDGAMAVSKDVYLPIDKDAYNKDAEEYGMDPSKWKWVRYDSLGRMYKGQVHAPISEGSEEWGYWWFDEITGAMQFGLTQIYCVTPKEEPMKDLYGKVIKDENGNPCTVTVWYKVDEKGNIVDDPEKAARKWVYYDDINGTMLKGEHILHERLYLFDKYDGTAIDGWYPDENGTLFWYEMGERQGYRPFDPAYRGKEIFDPTTKQWYWLDNVQKGTFATSKDVYLPTDTASYIEDEEAYGDDPAKWKWVRYNEYGHMIKGWHDKGEDTYYFDLITGAMYKGYREIDGVTHYFDEITGILQRQ